MAKEVLDLELSDLSPTIVPYSQMKPWRVSGNLDSEETGCLENSSEPGPPLI